MDRVIFHPLIDTEQFSSSKIIKIQNVADEMSPRGSLSPLPWRLEATASRNGLTLFSRWGQRADGIIDGIRPFWPILILFMVMISGVCSARFCQSMWDERHCCYSAATRHCHTVDEIGRLFAKKTRIDSFQFSIPSAPCIDAMNREKRPR